MLRMREERHEAVVESNDLAAQVERLQEQLLEADAEIDRLKKLVSSLEEITNTHVFGNTQIVDEEGVTLAVLEGDVNRHVIKEAIEMHINHILERFLQRES
jgi:hypothetical protein